MTDTVPQVYAAISAVMAHMAKEGISKDRKNSQQGYNFRGIDDIYAALGNVLAENKLVMLPFVQDMKREERQTKGGGTLNYTILTVDFKLVSAADASHDTIRMIGEAMDSVDKSSNKAQSAALKYAALQVFMIPVEGLDNDPDATTHELVGKPQGGMPDAEWSKLVSLAEASGTTSQELAKRYNTKNLRGINQQQYGDALDFMNTRLAEKAKGNTDKAAGFGVDADDYIPGFD